MKALTLSEIWIYPIKSLSGISLSSARMLPKGLQYDRRFMLVDDENKFITQRVHSILALFRVALSETHVQVTYEGDTLKVPLHPAKTNNTFQCTIWNDTVTVQEVSLETSQWFSKHLGFTCKLVFFPEEQERPVDEKYHVNHEHVSLADGYPALIIGQASLDDLNTRLEKPVPMNRFRPNFVFTGGEPYEEDRWREFSIGNNRFVGVKPCARCVLTTVDPETAKMGKEPLKTLSTYRTQNNKVLFGQNLVALDFETINVGDYITLI